MCVGETKTITHGLKSYFFGIFRDMSRKGYCVTISRRRSQSYCVSYLSSHRSDCGLRMQVSCLEDKPNMRAVPEGDTPEVVGRHLSIISIYDSKSEHTLSCTRGAACRRAWPKTWEGPLTIFIIYSTQQDKITHAWLRKYTYERATVASKDSLGPTYNICSRHRPA